MSSTFIDDTYISRTDTFPTLQNDAILKAAWGEAPHRLPVWIMRQAGRYLPEFMELRNRYSFFKICQTPKLACEVTLMPIKRYDLDAAIIFSDILVIPHALGMTVDMRPGLGPVLPKPLTVDSVKDLETDGVLERLKFVGDAITLTRHKLEGKVPLCGFAGAPWTLMGYMVEGQGSKTLSKAKKWLYQNPKETHEVLGLLSDIIIQYLVMQVQAGAQLLQIFDSSAEYLNKELYHIYGIPYLRKIYDEVRKQLNHLGFSSVPLILFAKGAHFALDDQAKLGYEVIGLDWTIGPKLGRKALAKKTLQGNLDPCALYAPPEQIKELTEKMIKEFGPNRLIVNLGHGIYPDVDVSAVSAFVEAVHAYPVHR